MNPFRAGQKVVCVDNTTATRNFVIGNIYQVHEVSPLYVSIEGIQEDDPMWEKGEQWFYYRFRALVEKKTDISIFQSLLTPTPTPTVKRKVKEDA
jgi:hypothetical protein